MSLILGGCEKVVADDGKSASNNINEDALNFPGLKPEPDPLLMTIIDNDVYFYSSINQKSSFELERVLIELDNRSKKTNTTDVPINLHIQSYGGSLHHSLYLIDLISNLETPVYTYIDGYAASAATLLSIAGKKRFMTKNSIMLIHQLSSGFEGKFNEIRDENENINNLMSFIVRYYLENTKLNIDELRGLLKRDLWLNSEKCLSYGLVDKII